jgi:phosphoribosylformylglycinamidine cyclo-ligase
LNQDKGLTYKDAGVDIEAGNRLVDRIKPMVARTSRPEVLAGLGGFGGLFELPVDRYKRPVLVSGTDGVGTKLKLAQIMGQHQTIGIDLVAMCVNDVIVQGAEPLFFLDYFATGKLDGDIAATVVSGIAEGCQQSGCALIGGETAEMPDMYAPGEYDLAGFNVGVVERDRLIDGSAISDGDVLIGLSSSGPHSNGYSLIRRVIERSGADLQQTFGETTLGQALLAPTQIYVRAVMAMLEQSEIHGMAHITGGGLQENIIRVVPDHLGVTISSNSWPRPAIFDWIQEHGGIEETEMLTTFNCGIGYCLIAAEKEVGTLMSLASEHGLEAFRIGRVMTTDGERVEFVGS